MKLFSVLAVLAIVLLPQSAKAQTATAYKTGENTTGTTKQCYYSFAGSSYTQTVSSVSSVSLCPLTMEVRTTGTPTPSAPPAPSSAMAYKTGENTTGTTKQCFYSYLSKEYTKTVQAFELCPLSIAVRP